MQAHTTTAEPAQHARLCRPASRRDMMRAGGGVGLLAIVAAALPAPVSAAARGLPSTAAPDAFLAACADFVALAEASWSKRAANGDYNNDDWPAIAARQAPLLDLICDTPAGHRADWQAGRVRCFEAADVAGDGDGIEDGDAGRLARAVMRDVAEA